ncbi:MAG: hypothetical protein U0R51_05385 [Solirubrobacterales bacterium]
MTRRWTTATPAIAIAAAVVALVSVATANAFPGPLPARVTADGVTVPSVVGSYCVTAEKGNAGLCADKILSRPGRRHRLSVAPRTGMTFEFRDQPKLSDDVRAASGSLLRFGDEGGVKGVGDVELAQSGDAWRATLPKQLHRANAMIVYTSLEDGGDISHVVSLESSRRQPLRCPGKFGVPVRAREIRGMTVPDAKAYAKQRGCMLRVVRVDGVDQVITEDFSLDRVNVIVRDDRVVGIDGIY